jgi:tRNA threonylcarbamoyladenosine biosynthesis protein TsaB
LNILAFDCAGSRCAAALAADGHVVAARSISSERGHAQFLMPMLCDVLAEAGLGFGDLDRFAVTTGPGSFTGIRVGLATARGLALGTGKPAIGLTVFEAMAEAAAERGIEGRVLVAIESRRAEYFLQLFHVGPDDPANGMARAPGIVPLGEPTMLLPEHIRPWIGEEPAILIGDAARTLAPRLPEPLPADSSIDAVDPASLARLAATRVPGPPPRPFYCREPDAVPAGQAIVR